MFDLKKIQPYAPGGRELFGKVGVGLSVGVIVAILMFIILSFVSSIFMKATGINADTAIYSNPLLSFVCLFIGFLSSFIGNFLQVLAYNLFYSKKYYNVGKVFGLLLLTNAIILGLVGPIYFLFSTQLVILFIILAFHVLLSIFISMNVVEFSLSPNYANSSLVGNTFGFGIVMLMYAIFWKSNSGGVLSESSITLSIILPPILGYTLIPLGLGIWEKIYLKFYEMGSNPFYIDSATEQEVNTDEEEINIDLD
ncbi:MAG: hypothetical protein CR971_00525 [candidate division SR1 bacterium]|nr:MAG: hypothetical protein CR971_00525 [candidate division SR1 bacterium]